MFGLVDPVDVKTKQSSGYRNLVFTPVLNELPYVLPTPAAASSHSPIGTLMYPASSHVACEVISLYVVVIVCSLRRVDDVALIARSSCVTWQ